MIQDMLNHGLDISSHTKYRPNSLVFFFFFNGRMNSIVLDRMSEVQRLHDIMSTTALIIR